MHSDFLNQDKICEMFNQEHELVPRKEQVSLNFTVTSRQSKGAIPAYQSKTYTQFQNNHQNQQHNRFNTHLKANSPQRSMGNALEELDKFNNWLNLQNIQNQKLLSEVSTLSSLAQSSRSVLLTMPDFGYIKKKCSKSVKANSTSAGQKNFGQNYYFEAPGACMACKEKDELIEIINQQYNAKLDQCYAKQVKLKAYEKQKQCQLRLEIRNSLLDGVELNLIKQQNVNLSSQISNLRMQIEKQKLEKSILMQKSTSLLKTKQLEKKSDSSCTNSKLFSNAKYSTNAINPNDTMNRVDSIICFGDTEPNLEELIRFYGEQANTFKLKHRQFKQLGSQQDKKGGGIKKLSINELKTINNNYQQDSYHKLSQLYKQIQSKLMDLKSYKLKHPQIFAGYAKQRRAPEEEDLTLSNRQQIQQFKKIIMGLQKKIKGIQNQNNNLQQTNFDLVSKLSQLAQRLRECDQILKHKNQSLKFYQDHNSKLISQCKMLHQKCKSQSAQRKKIVQDLQNIKGNMRFYCRVRPRFGSEVKSKTAIAYSEDNKIIKDNRQYEFNSVFSEKSTQSQIYQQIKGLVECAYEGKNLCIFAYGQTGSGKTYTIHGNKQRPGLAHKIFRDLFLLMEGDSKIYDTVITMTIVQIYKQQIRDLLGISDHIEVKQDPERGVYLDQYKPIKVTKIQQLLQLYNTGIENRDKFEGNIIPDSSRSHSVFSLLIEKTRKKKQQKQPHHKQAKQIGDTTFSKITLVDLAGSEKITNSNPMHIKDAQFINKNMANLALVLSGIKNKSKNIPYRDTKLTLMLKQSLTPNSNIVTFINVIPSQICSVETTNSLLFAERAKTSQNLLKYRDPKEKQGKQNQKNRRSSTRLSIG